MQTLFGMASNYTIVIDRELKNGNNGQTKHWGASHKERAAWLKKVKDSYVIEPNGSECMTLDFLDCYQPPKYQGLLITRHLGKNQRFLDPDSVLRGNAKQAIDSLIEIGVAPDDSIKHLKFVIGLQCDKNRELGPYTSVEVFS
jgi:hypothetical protein